MRFKSWQVLAVFLAIVPVATAQTYTITDLGTLPGGDASYATGLNNSGQVVGWGNVVNTYGNLVAHGFSWTKTDGMRDLGTLSFPDPFTEANFNSWANHVNERGTVAGGSWADPEGNSALTWTRTGAMRDLGIPVGMRSTDAEGINLFGQVVGAAFEFGPGDSGPMEAFLWTSAGGMQLLGTLPSGQYSWAYAINDVGQVVGNADINYDWHAFLWTQRTGMEDLGQWSATAINNFGKIAGYQYVGPQSVAVVWTRRNGLQALPALPGSNGSAASAIDSFGYVVGWSTMASNPSSARATLWSTRTGVWDLNTLIPVNSGWVLQQAMGINSWGQVVGNGTLNGQSHAFLLTPKFGHP